MGARPSDLPKVLITDAMRCRISHLAVCSKARVLLNLIYGPKGDREGVDDYNLRVSQLWIEVANSFVNSESWMPTSEVEYYDLFRELDTTTPPAAPGLDIQTIKDTWMSIRTDWSRLFTAVFGQTGASVTAGDQLYDTAYKNFICGTRMTFTHKLVAQYVFILWHSSFVELPQWCNRTLAPEGMLRAGVGGTTLGAPGFTSPDKGKNGGKASSPGSIPALDKLLEAFTKKMEREEITKSDCQESVKAERMDAIQKQLAIIYAARKLVDDESQGSVYASYTSAIEKLNTKLLAECAE